MIKCFFDACGSLTCFTNEPSEIVNLKIIILNVIVVILNLLDIVFVFEICVLFLGDGSHI